MAKIGENLQVLKVPTLCGLSLDLGERIKALDQQIEFYAWDTLLWESIVASPRYYALFILCPHTSPREQDFNLNPPLGFALLHETSREDPVHLLKIVIDRNYRRAGLANVLLHSIIDYYREQNHSSRYLLGQRLEHIESLLPTLLVLRRTPLTHSLCDLN